MLLYSASLKKKVFIKFPFILSIVSGVEVQR